jgi:hypothetical protein
MILNDSSGGQALKSHDDVRIFTIHSAGNHQIQQLATWVLGAFEYMTGCDIDGPTDICMAANRINYESTFSL